MSWAPNDLLSDSDLADYEARVMSDFGQTTWAAKRTKVFEDWLWPILRANGLNPDRFRTRFAPQKVWGFTGSAYTDYTTAAGDTSEDDLNLGTVFATVGTDALYLGSIRPFRGLHLRILESVSAVTSLMTVAYWADQWTALTIADGTAKTAGKTCSGGGSVTWGLPSDWVVRKINASDPLYWVKVTVSATPTSAKASQIGVIHRSALCAPAALRTLMWIFREAPTSQDGPWKDKAAYYEQEADFALQRALPVIGGEFDTTDPANPTDVVDPTAATQTTAEASGVGSAFVWERG